MAEEPQKPAPAEQVTVEKPATSDETAEKPLTTTEETAEKAVTTTEETAEKAVTVEEKAEATTEEVVVEEKSITQLASFKEESNVVSDLPEAQKKALDEIKKLIQEALNKHELTAPPPPKAPPATEPEAKKKEPEVPAEAEKKEDVVAAAEAEKEEDVVAAEEAEKKEDAVAAAAEGSERKEIQGEKKEDVVAAAEAEKKGDAVAAEEAEKKEDVVAAAAAAAEGSEKKEIQGEKKEDVVAAAEESEKKEIEVAVEEAEKKEEVVTGEEEKKEVEEAEKKEEAVAAEEVEIWGIPLLADERSDVILLKFLRARDFKVKEAFTMIKNTVRWRKEFGIEKLVEEDLGSDWDKVVFNHGYDKQGHPVCYNVFGEFENKELYQKSFSEEEKREKFIRWRIQLLEKSVRKLDFSPKGISTIVQVNDLKNSPGLGKWELRQATNRALQLLQDNYPEFVAKQIFINVPWWYLAFSRMISAFLTQRTKSKFVFAGPSKSPDTLFKYIAPEQVPIQYGGLSGEGAEQEFTSADPVTEVTIKPATKHAVEIPVSEKSHLVWEIRVVGWDVTYGAEFVPSAEDGYTVIVHKSRKIAPTDETVIFNAFKIGEAGKVVLTIDNQTSKKKKLLYRSKIKPISD